eukprot:1164449-Heterocapsa_arctica.AAC.1
MGNIGNSPEAASDAPSPDAPAGNGGKGCEAARDQQGYTPANDKIDPGEQKSLCQCSRETLDELL